MVVHFNYKTEFHLVRNVSVKAKIFFLGHPDNLNISELLI
jgi:hypothetical protein